MAEHPMISVDRSMLPANKPEASVKTERQESGREALDSVIKNGVVKEVKPSIGKRIRNLFISEDIGDVKSWLLYDVTIPFLKDTVLDFLAMLFYGSASVRRRDNKSSSSRSNYSGAFKSRNDNRRRERDYGAPAPSKINYQCIVLTDRYDAKEVVEALYERIEKYGSASIADLLELTGHSSYYNDTCYGWESPSQIGIKRVSDGYLIDVATAEPII